MSVRALPRPAVRAVESESNRDWLWQFLFLGAHVELALLIPKYSPYLAWHARLAMLSGVILALTTRRWERVACAAAYITGAEVFWRMRRAELPWEFGKYAVVLVLAIAIVRFGRVRRSPLPIAFFLLLLPSAMLTFFSLDPAEARSQLSFNLSGPLALAVCALFFSALKLTRRELRWVYVCLLGPIVSIATVATVTFNRVQPEQFGNESSWVGSGGFGPNQVSAILGLGVLAAVFWIVSGPGNTIAAAAFGLLTLYLLRQCAMTFSRGGLYMAVGGILAAAFYLTRDRRSRWRLLGAAAVVLPLLLFVVWPRLEALTSGAIGARFSDTETTGRGLLVQADLKTWSENPVMGAGPGMGGKNRLKVFYVPTAHTEYSRLLAEHGVFGLAALAILILISARNIRTAPTRLDKALAAGMLAYSLLSLAVDGMRLVSASFAFGISGARLLLPRRRVPAAAAPDRGVPRIARKI